MSVAHEKRNEPSILFKFLSTSLIVAVLAFIALTIYQRYTGERDQQRRMEAAQSLFTIGDLIQKYKDENQNNFPPMDNLDHFKASVNKYLMPYDKQNGRDPYVNPDTKLPYLLNSALSHKSIDLVDNPGTTWLVRESKPDSEGKIGVLYVNYTDELFYLNRDGNRVGGDFK